jgi:hypothetical protein
MCKKSITFFILSLILCLSISFTPYYKSFSSTVSDVHLKPASGGSETISRVIASPETDDLHVETKPMLSVSASDTSTYDNSSKSSNVNGTNFLTNITSKVSFLTQVNITNLPNLPSTVPYIGPGTFEHETEEFFLRIPNETSVSTNVFTLSSTTSSYNRSSLDNLTHISTPILIDQLPTLLDQSTNQCNGCVPPDVQIAAGVTPQYNTQIILINKAVEIQGQTFPCPIGQLCTGGAFRAVPVYIGSFFGFSSGSINELSDPKILFDKLSERWFASILDATTNTVRLAVSPPANSPGLWNIFVFPFDGCPDQPKIGVNDNLLAISAGIISPDCSGEGSFIGTQVHLIKKSDLINGVDPPMTVTVNPSSPIFSRTLTPLTPVHSLGPNSDLMLVGTDWSELGQFLAVYTYNMVGSAPQAMRCQPCLFPTQINSAVPSNQPDTIIRLKTNDNRVLDAAWHQGKLWFTFNDSCFPSDETTIHSCFRLVQLDTVGVVPGLEFIARQDFDVASSRTDIFFPAIRIDDDGNLVLVFGASSLTLFPSVFVSSQNVGDPPETLRTPTVLAAGTASDTSSTGNSQRCRDCSLYGDYFSAAVDAVDPSIIWVAGQYMTMKDLIPAYSIVVAQLK